MPKLGNQLYLAIDAGPIHDEDGALIAVVETLRDMTDQKRAEAALKTLASSDGLAGLADRRSFDGVLLTKTAMKETATGPTRVERVARSEREAASAPQLTSAKEMSPASSALPPELLAAHSDAVPAAQAEAMKPDVRRETEVTRELEPTKPADQSRATEQTKAEQQKAAERKIERQKRNSERKAREITAVRMRPRRLEVQDQPERPELPLGQEEPHFNVFRMRGPLPFGNSDSRDDD